MYHWKLKNLINHCETISTYDEKLKTWIPARPLNYKFRTFLQKTKQALDVFKGKADSFVWPENEK